jgi:opacity protein-like surface antigen
MGAGIKVPKLPLLATILICIGSQSATAQTIQGVGPNCSASQTGLHFFNTGAVLSQIGQTTSTIAAAISTVETAFLAQQGSALVSAPPNPAPDQPGGGIWVRGVGGEANIQSVSNSTLNITQTNGGNVANNTTNLNCANAMHLTFQGFQAGTDIARLNWNGWNVHLGSTAGYLGAKTNDTNQLFPFSNRFEVPFLGAYVVATKGRFFADLMVREEFFNINLGNPGFAFANQPVGAHGFSVSTSAGYNLDAGNGWFIEPSGGFIYSRTAVDAFGAPAVAFPGFGFGPATTVAINDIQSELGRLSLRVGKTVETPNVIWQPFASVSVFHEFAGNATATGFGGSFCVGGPCGPFPNTPINQVIQSSSTRIGTYEQYSLGVAGQVVNTGWLGYVRADYKDGANIQGWGVSAGLRYQYTPENIAAVMPTKVKAPVPVVLPTNWTGFYIGGIFGAQEGRTDISTVNTTPIMQTRPWVAGALGGGEAGYNYQFNNSWVAGVEGDIAATNTKGARMLAGAPPAFLIPPPVGPTLPFPNALVAGDDTNWVATITGRFGYAWDRTLFYVKAGGAFENSSISVKCYDPQFNRCENPALLPIKSGQSIVTASTRAGWTAGFGTEFDLGRGWSAKSELDYLSFGTHTALASDGTTVLSDWSRVWQGKIGLNYRFEAGPTVVAKY